MNSRAACRVVGDERLRNVEARGANRLRLKRLRVVRSGIGRPIQHAPRRDIGESQQELVEAAAVDALGGLRRQSGYAGEKLDHPSAAR